MKKSIYTIFIICLIVTSTTAQSIWESFDELLFSCDPNTPCLCLEEEVSLQEHRISTVGSLLFEFKKTAGIEELRTLKSYYDKVDAAFTDCWLGHFTNPQTLAGPINFDWISLYYSFESAIRYIELNQGMITPVKNVDWVKNKIVGFTALDEVTVIEWASIFYNQKVFNPNNFTLIFSLDAYYEYIIDNFPLFESILAKEIGNFNPESSRGEQDRIFDAWRSIFIKSGASDKFLKILETKKKEYEEAGRLEEYNFWKERLGGD